MKKFPAKTTSSNAAALLSLMALGLAACGGGGGGGDDTANKKPTVDAGTQQDVLARKTVTLEATATDSDGSIAKYAWSQAAGSEVTLSATDDDFLEFTAPSVDEQETLTFSLTVTDNDGATATDTVDVTVTPSVTLKAKAYDGPLAGATVTVTVGDKSYTATANADGEFVLDIGSPDPGAMITIVATGGAGQEHAELVSIAGTFGALTAAAGEDGTLESTESGVVNVTNLSTAKAVLMIRANGGEAPADDDTLANLEKNVDSSAVLELATVIKLVIDANVALPDGVSSTFDLVQDDAAVDTVIASAATKDPDLFNETMNAILGDPNLSTAFTADEVPGIYFVNRAGNFVSSNRGFAVELEDDGTGYIYGGGPADSAAFAWAVTNGEIVVTLDEGDPIFSEGSCSTDMGLVHCEVTTTAMRFRRVIQGASVDTVARTNSISVHYPGGEYPDETRESTAMYLAMDPGALEAFSTADVSGTWSVPLSLPNPDVFGDRYEAGLLTFNENGTGQRYEDGRTFDWELDTDGVLHAQFADGDVLSIYGLRTEGDIALDAMVIMMAESGGIYSQPHLVVQDVDVDLAGTLMPNGMNGYWQYMDWPGFHYELDNTSGVATEYYYSSLDDVTPDVSPSGFIFDGVVAQVQMYRDGENGPRIADCDAAAACFLGYVSNWYPLAKDSSGRIYMLERDEGWAFDGANEVGKYQGEKNYRHGVNRWLDPMPEDTEDSAKPSAPETAVRGGLVRSLLGDTAMQGMKH